MHEHAPREAALLERTLKNGMHDPKILHSFQLGKTSNPRGTGPRDELPKSYAFAQDDPNLPDIEVFVHDDRLPQPLRTRDGHLPQQCVLGAGPHGDSHSRTRGHSFAQQVRSCALKMFFRPKTKKMYCF